MAIWSGAYAQGEGIGRLLNQVPARSVAVYVSRPTATDQSKGGGRSLAAAVRIADLAGRAGLLRELDEITRFWIDAVSTLPLVQRHPHAIALIDVLAEPRPGQGHRLASLKVAAVVHTGGDNDAISARIQELLGLHTNTSTTHLSKTTVDGVEQFTLRDVRLADWMEVGWAFPGEYCVIGVGEGALQRACATIQGSQRSLHSNDWLSGAVSAKEAKDARYALYLDFARIRGSGDAVLQKKVDNVQSSLRLADAQQVLLTVSFAGRSVEIHSLVHGDKRDQTRTISGRCYKKRLRPQSIPDEANGYAIVDCNPEALVEAMSAAYLSARSPEGRQECFDYWSDLQRRAGVDITADIFGRLGNTVLIHNYPRHALDIPLLWTVHVPVAGRADALRSSVHSFLGVVRDELRDDSIVQLSEDGSIWYLHFGIQGPAITVTEEALLLSFSPMALRANMQRLGYTPDHAVPATNSPAPAHD